MTNAWTCHGVRSSCNIIFSHLCWQKHQAIMIIMMRCVTFPTTTGLTDTKPVNPKWKSKSKSQAMSHLYEYKSIWKKKTPALFMERFIKMYKIGNSRKMIHGASVRRAFIHSLARAWKKGPNWTNHQVRFGRLFFLLSAVLLIQICTHNYCYAVNVLCSFPWMPFGEEMSKEM